MNRVMVSLVPFISIFVGIGWRDQDRFRLYTIFFENVFDRILAVIMTFRPIISTHYDLFTSCRRSGNSAYNYICHYAITSPFFSLFWIAPLPFKPDKRNEKPDKTTAPIWSPNPHLPWYGNWWWIESPCSPFVEQATTFLIELGPLSPTFVYMK